MKKIPNKKAFTLAEVLISLMIMGVVSALTIPQLKSHSDEQKYVALAQKAYNTIVNATTLAETKYGEFQFWDSGKVIDYYKSVMEIQPHSGTLSSTLDGVGGGDRQTVSYSFMTADGFYWMVSPGATSTFLVDVNGIQPPNIVGIDGHNFYVKNEGVTGANDCTKYILKHGKMPWLKKSMTDCPAL